MREGFPVFRRCFRLGPEVDGVRTLQEARGRRPRGTLFRFSRILGPSLLLVLSGFGCGTGEEKMQSEQSPFSITESDFPIGGLPVLTLNQALFGTDQVRILSADLLPGRGLNTYQIQAYVPGRGVVKVLRSPSLEEARDLLSGGPEDPYGNRSFSVGGALLIPFANRIRGTFLPDQDRIETLILGRPVRLPANWKGKRPDAEPAAIHGLIQTLAVDILEKEVSADKALVTGRAEAGNFNGHWLSETRLDFQISLQADRLELEVTATNVGREPLPMGIGWHPWFRIPSGERAQVRLTIPARKRLVVNNYSDVFPTGEVVPVAGTPYDFSPPGGALLSEQFLDDCFVDLEEDEDGNQVAEIVDPASGYGVRVISASPAIQAIQVYAPTHQAVVALEPQFNWIDPYSDRWPPSVDTGMAVLSPGQSVSYRVAVEIFQP